MATNYLLLVMTLAVPLGAFAATDTFDPKDWGPAYQPGMEHGPASAEHDVAAHNAERFIAQQKFAADFAKRACAMGGNAGSIDVEFALLSDKTGKTRGTVRVNSRTGECAWLGVKEALVEKLKAEIERLEALCVPKEGTTRAEVERRFGEGKPAAKSKITPKEGISPDSPYRSYSFCTNGMLFVHYGENGLVDWTHYENPYSLKGRFASPTVEEELEELEPRLKQMLQIEAEYWKRFGEK